jgi:hypothetical protein
MSKRFTDTDRWKKPFIRSLEAPYKLLWFYICDDCDHAGIWQVDLEVAQIRIGEDFDLTIAINSFGDKVVPFDNGTKWFIPSFIEFQYGELKENNRVHDSIIKILKKYKLIGQKNKPLTSPLQGCKDMDMDKDKDMDKEKEKDVKNKKNEEIPTKEEFMDYCRETYLKSGKNFEDYKFSVELKYDSWVLNNWKDGNDSKIKNWKSKINNTIPHLIANVKQTVQKAVQPYF